MNLGVNPLLQFGLEETREELCWNILTALSMVNYVPFDSDTIGNPALDLGDVLIFSGGQADARQVTCVTSFTIKIGGRQSLKCVGKNPRLSQAKSKNDKNISGLLNQIEAGKIGIHTFTNASAYTIAETNVRIISIEFASKEENHAQFFGQVIVDAAANPVERTANATGTIIVPFPMASADTGTEEDMAVDTTEDSADVPVDVSLPVTWSEDGKTACYVTFELNNAEILLHHPVETWHSGKHILSLYYPIENIVPNITNTFNVYLRMEDGSGSVGIGDCIASISGQAMAAAAAWDGRIDIEESAALFSINSGLQARGFTEAVDVGDDGTGTEKLCGYYDGKDWDRRILPAGHTHLSNGRITSMVLKGVMTIELTDENTGRWKLSRKKI